MSVGASPCGARFPFAHALARQTASDDSTVGRRQLRHKDRGGGQQFGHPHVFGRSAQPMVNSWVWGLRWPRTRAPDRRGSLTRKTLRPLVISDSNTKLLYQYDDQAPPSWVGTSGGGSDQATVAGLAGSVKSVTHVPAWWLP